MQLGFSLFDFRVSYCCCYFCFQDKDLSLFCGDTSCAVRVKKEKLFDGSQNKLQSGLKAEINVEAKVEYLY